MPRDAEYAELQHEIQELREFFHRKLRVDSKLFFAVLREEVIAWKGDKEEGE